MRYARHLTAGDVREARLSAVWRRDRAAGAGAAAELGTRFEGDLEALITAPDVDVVVAAVPAGLHATVAAGVAAARKPLLLEKPIARTVAEAAEITAAFARAGAPLMVAQTLRFDPLVGLLRAHAADRRGIVGFAFEQRLEPRGLAWERDPELAGGGVALQTGIHTLDALRFVTGSDRVEVLGAALGQVHPAEVEDHASIQLAVELPARVVIGQVAASKIGRARTLRFALHLEDRTIEADLVQRRFIETRGREARVVAVPEAPTVIAVLHAFLGWLAGEHANPVSGEDATRSLALVEAAYALGRRRPLPDARDSAL